jgi:hypothetical protein
MKIKFCDGFFDGRTYGMKVDTDWRVLVKHTRLSEREQTIMTLLDAAWGGETMRTFAEGVFMILPHVGAKQLEHDYAGNSELIKYWLDVDFKIDE